MKRRKTITPILTSTVPDRVREDDEPHMVGYARVSMSDQNNQRQVDELVKFGVAACDIFSDKASGKSMDRPSWNNLWRNMQRGDLLVVLSLDRLGRDLLEILQMVQELHDRGINLKVLTGIEIDTRTATGKLIFHVFAAFAQFERELIVERTMHGLEKARERGVVFGTKPTYSDEQIIEAMQKTNNNYEKAGKLIGAKKITMIRRWKTIQNKQLEAH
jgi:DNA invertase Pin-like site-specific DNA recombinase